MSLFVGCDNTQSTNNTVTDTNEVGSPMDKGRCYCRNSGCFSNMSGMQANHSCSHYERWALLKK